MHKNEKIIKMDDQAFQRDLASFEHEQGFLKHLTTLSTGSIVIIATFLEKLFANPEWRILVSISIASFLLSIVGSLITYLFSVLRVNKDQSKKIPKPVLILVIPNVALAFGGFLSGIICLGVFAIKNFN